MSRVLVTGGAGFLGQYLIARLAEEGHEITLVDLRPSRAPILDVEQYCTSAVYGVDVARPRSLLGLFHQMDCVYHLAGIVSFWRKDAGTLQRVNVLGTRNVVQAAIAAEVQRFIHISSVAAIGFNQESDEPIDEDYDFDWSAARGKHYMLSKYLSEHEVRKACAAGLNAVIVNPGLMWGPGDRLNSEKLIWGIKSRTIPACPPGGTNVVDVRDVAAGLSHLLHVGRVGERYILGGANVTFREIYQTIAEVVGGESPRIMMPRLAAPLLFNALLLHELMRRRAPALTSDHIDSAFRFRYFDSSKASTELQWQPRYTLFETIRDSVAWLDRHALVTVAS